ncbi:hypothetical protein [Bacillus sp. USDA818B3_A]|uniref:hypothetical protein n=1 Tax=Bacillus sp. USDA818B3_A TaxID=2698834 RepID=UPI00136AED2B|nr:hypothetical protein [Bacillus sp. USDA818B3_A]
MKQIASFVVRFQLEGVEEDSGKKQWRIKITYVQEERETLFEKIEDALEYMKDMVDQV